MTSASLSIDGEHITPGRLTATVDRILGDLRELGVSAGAAVALASNDPLVTVAALLATERLDASLVLSGSNAPRMMPGAAIIRDAGPGRPTVSRGDDRPAAAALPDVGAVFWTSGSSGQPKAVALSRRALSYQGAATARHLGIHADDRMLLPLPLHHAYAYSVLQVWRATGAHLCIETEFRVQRIAERIREERITTVDAVPTMYRLLATEAARDADIGRVLALPRLRGCGGEPLSPGLFGLFLKHTGAVLHDGYGLTEAGPNVALSTPHHFRRGTVGRPLDGVEVRIDGDAGEIQVRSPSVMSGYIDFATGEVSRAAFTADGWLRTGDAGSLSSDGFLTVTGRIKEVLIVHGETIAPTVLEDVIRNVRGVDDAAVIGVRDGIRSEVIHAFVTGGHDAPSPVQLRLAVLAACREALPPQLRPRAVHVVPRLPRTGTGKRDKERLRMWAASTAAAS